MHIELMLVGLVAIAAAVPIDMAEDVKYAKYTPYSGYNPYKTYGTATEEAAAKTDISKQQPPSPTNSSKSPF